MKRWIVLAFAVLCLSDSASPAGVAPSSAGGWKPGEHVVADVNGDGHLDLVAPASAAVQVLLGGGDGTFQAPQSFPAGADPTVILAGDLNGDANADLVAVHLDDYYTTHELHVLLSNGDGTFESPQSLTLPLAYTPEYADPAQYLGAATLGDLDGDGNLDLIAGVHRYYYYYDEYGEYSAALGFLIVLRGNGDGTFDSGTVLDLGEGWTFSNLATADFNGDGRMDVVSGGGMPLAYPGLCVRLGNGDGTLQAPRETYAGGAGFSVVTPTPVWDMDRDGKLDLLVFGGNGIECLRGNGDGTFDRTEVAPFGVGSPVQSALVGDVNADGILDVVGVRMSFEYKSEWTGYDEWGNATYRYYDIFTTRSAGVLLGYGNGLFDLTASWDLGRVEGWSPFYTPILADLDGDGLPDLASKLGDVVMFARNPGNWPAPFPSIRIDDATVTEGDAGTTSAAFTVRLSAPHNAEIAVDYRTVAGSATLGGDVVATTGTVRFAAGDTSETILVQVVGDLIYESPVFGSFEAFTVELSNATANASIADAQGFGMILDNDPHAVISIDSVTVTEGDEGTTPAVFTVRLSQPYPHEVTVDFSTGGEEVVASSGTVRFAPGEVSQSIVVQVVGDRRYEGTEYFWVSLWNATPAPNVWIDYYLGSGTILDNDVLPDVRIRDVSRTEGQNGSTSFQFTVTLSNAYPDQVTVYYRTLDGTAKGVSKKPPSGDYTSTSGSVAFPPGTTTRTISVQVRGDREVEAAETFYVELTSAQRALIVEGPARGTILNDD